MIRSASSCGGILAIALAVRVSAQSPEQLAGGKLAELARAGTARYADRATAIADGYRAVGPEAPAMGQHWVNVRLLLNDGIDPAHPAILTYAMIGGAPQLAGVAYARVLGPGDPDPVSSSDAEPWHFHASSVSDEAMLLRHEHHGAAHTGETRIAVLHAWVWIANPEGLFAADNWALPYLRAGLAAPPAPLQHAGHALALARGGIAFLVEQYATAAQLDARDRAALAKAFAAASDRVNRWLADRTSLKTSNLSPADRDFLAELWSTTLLGLRKSLSAAGSGRLETVLP